MKGRPAADALSVPAFRTKARRLRGRLKIFFGAAAGVGKTFAMLLAARDRLVEGIDVLVGFVDTHGKKDTLLNQAPDLNFYLLGSETDGQGNPRGTKAPPVPPPSESQIGYAGFLWGMTAPLLCTALIWPFRDSIKPANTLLIYLLGVFFVAIRFGRAPSILACLLTAAAFAFLYAPPIFSLAISEPDNLMGLSVMLVVAAVTSHLTENVRSQARIAAQRERRASALYQGRAGLALARTFQPNLVILDLGLPDMEGMDVVACLRKRSERPIIILSARNRESDITSALDSGADDYLTKPFNPSELLARIRAVLRRSAARKVVPDREVYRVGELRVETGTRRVYMGDREIHLTPIEYQLLTMLARHAGLVVTHRQLLAEIWGGTHMDQIHYVRIYMGHLRHKLEADPARPLYILTEAGVGYRLHDGG